MDDNVRTVRPSGVGDAREGSTADGAVAADPAAAGRLYPRALSTINLPNFISLLRLAAVPLVVWLVLIGRLDLAFGLFVAAGVSDAIDGYLARKLDARTRLGTYLDPLADKMLLVCVFVVLGYVGALETWLVILVVSRDVMIVGGLLLLVLLGQRLEVQPTWTSKFNTLAQIAFATLVLARYGLALDGPLWRDAVEAGTYFVAATTLLSGAVYVWLGVRHMAVIDGNGRSRQG
jgi:cardiolipin synthase